jgi:small-conductance mechanosensitive channel
MTHLRNFIVATLVLGAIAEVAIFMFDTFVAVPGNLPVGTSQLVRAAIVVTMGALAYAFVRHFSAMVGRYLGAYAASVASFVLVVVDILVVALVVLRIFEVPMDSLLLGGGIISIIVGLAVSTYFGNIFSGALMLLTKQFSVGDTVLVNNIPGKIEQVNTMFTKISNDSGTETIVPNSAIIQGGIIVSKIPPNSTFANRLPFEVGDRIHTSYMGGQGIVISINSLYTKVKLDDGKEVSIPNSGILTGTIHIAKVPSSLTTDLIFTMKVDWDAEKAIKAMDEAAAADHKTFKTKPTVTYSSLEGRLVELRVECQVNIKDIMTAKSTLMKAAYLARNEQI